jgi:hypothetical protein
MATDLPLRLARTHMRRTTLLLAFGLLAVVCLSGSLAAQKSAVVYALPLRASSISASPRLFSAFWMKRLARRRCGGSGDQHLRRAIDAAVSHSRRAPQRTPPDGRLRQQKSDLGERSTSSRTGSSSSRERKSASVGWTATASSCGDGAWQEQEVKSDRT